MIGKYSYLLWLTVFVWLPEISIYLKFRSFFDRYRKTLLMAVLGSLAFSWPWDYLVVKNGAWYFPPEKILGLWIGGIPLEEHLFIVFVGLLLAMATLILRRRYV